MSKLFEEALSKEFGNLDNIDLKCFRKKLCKILLDVFPESRKENGYVTLFGSCVYDPLNAHDIDIIGDKNMFDEIRESLDKLFIVKDEIPETFQREKKTSTRGRGRGRGQSNHGTRGDYGDVKSITLYTDEEKYLTKI